MAIQNVNPRAKIIIATSTTFAINSFFEHHIQKLATSFDLIIVSDNEGHALLASISEVVDFENMRIRRQPSLFHDLMVVFKFIALIEKHKPTVILTMTPKVGLLFAIAGAITRVSVRVHIITGQVWQNYSGLKRFIYKLYDRALIALITRPLADSRSQIDYLIEQGVSPKGRIEVLANGSVTGVNLELFKPNPQLRTSFRQKLGLSDNDRVVLFLGRLVEDKGIFDAVEAVARVSEKLDDIYFWCAGPDEIHASEKVRQLANSRRINYHYFGKVKTTFDLFCSADVLILPSRREGFGSVIIEAAACGVPAVAYKTYGVSDAIVDQNTGLLADYGDIDDLARNLLYLLESTTVNRGYGARARARAAKQFNKSILVNRLYDIIEKDIAML